jgi:hypothetical protein
VTVAKLWILSCVVAGALLAQPLPSLRITAPAAGTIVNPGQSIKVVVEASGVFKNVGVGCKPIGGSDMLAAPPYQWTIEVPKDAVPGPCPLTAVGFGPPPQPVDSESVGILVELPDDAALRLVAEYPELEFHKGDTFGQLIWGLFPDGRRVDLTNSSRISFKSSAPNVAAVDYRGVITAVAPGSATETISYKDLHIDVPVTVLPNRP